MLRQPIYPVLIALYPIIAYYNVNSQYQAAKVIVIPVIVSIVITGLLWLLLFIVLKNWRKAALLSFIVNLLFWSYGYLYNGIYEVRVDLGVFVFGPNKAIFSVFVLIVFVCAVYLNRSRRKFEYLTVVLNAACLVLFALPASGIIWDKLAPAVLEETTRDQALDMEAALVQSNAGHFPDIYHILLDAYGRQDIYRELYDYDNSDLLEYLEAQDFYVARQAHANYSWTAPAVAAFMNMNYLEQVVPDVAEDETDRTYLFSAIRDNRVFDVLREKGYRIVALESGLPTTDFDWRDVTIYSPNSAGIWGLGFLNEFQAGLLELTPVPHLVKVLFGSDRISQYALTRQYMEFAFDNLGRSTLEPDPDSGSMGPKLVFTHIAGPHAPHLYTEDGKPFDPPERQLEAREWCRMRGLSRDIYIARHTSYVKYLNKRLKQALQRIIDSATRDFVIIVQSDHGPRAWCNRDNLLDPAFVRERLSILTAIYMPGQHYENLYQTMTPVNIYRAIFNTVLGTEFALLPDKSHMNTFKNPYRHVLIREEQLE